MWVVMMNVFLNGILQNVKSIELIQYMWEKNITQKKHSWTERSQVVNDTCEMGSSFDNVIYPIFDGI